MGSTVIRDLTIRQLTSVRAAMVECLSHCGRALSQEDLAGWIALERPQFAKWSGEIFGLVDLAVRIYETEFQRHPKTGGISLKPQQLRRGTWTL